jgi:hypothetical protein
VTLHCPLCGEGLRPTGLQCPTCSADVGWWFVTGDKATGPYELRDVRERYVRGEFDAVDWILLGEHGLRQNPQTVAQLLRGAGQPQGRLIEDWYDVRNLVRLLVILLAPLLALVLLVMAAMALRYWP